MTDNNLVAALSAKDESIARFGLQSISPDDGKYAKDSQPLVPFLSAEADWMMCANVQLRLLETRAEFGKAKQRHVEEVRSAVRMFDPLNAALLEDKLKHDQLAVIEELGRYISPETKALLHPGTTSYDILDTARTYLLRQAWKTAMRPKVTEFISKLCDRAEEYVDLAQAGRTHLQLTSPVTFGQFLSNYARRLAERVQKADAAFGDLRGKISGIVGTGASIDAVIGEGQSLDFERAVLEKFNLEPDFTATQITARERMTDVGHATVTLIRVLGCLAEDLCILYSSEIGEVVSLSSQARLGGSSADAGKDNPVNWENISGKVVVVESGMRVCYAQMDSKLQRDLRNSVQARYQPAGMLAETYESFSRGTKALDELTANPGAMARNLQRVRDRPTEAMTAILRASGWVHPKHGVGHDAVKVYARQARKDGATLLVTARNDPEFELAYQQLPTQHQRTLNGELEQYLGSAKDRARHNIDYARSAIGVNR